MAHKKKQNKKGKLKALKNAAQSGAAFETASTYGSAIKEHYVAYSGRDNETKKQLKRGLKKISESKVNPEYAKQNIKAQAGFAAEDKYTARQNAENIIKGKKTRFTRTDDIGRVNAPLHDHVILDQNGIEIPGTGEQMKFVGSSPKACLTKLKSKQFEKYLDADAKITVPSDYYQGIITEANNEISSLEKQLIRAKRDGNSSLTSSIEKKIAKVRKIRDSVKDSGITNEEAIYARLHPKLSTAKDIVKLSHRAGVSQAKYGAAIGSGISIIRNVVAVVKGEKTTKDAAIEVVGDTGKGAVTGYVTAFAGSAIKGTMQNSNSGVLRAISKTNAPATMVNATLEIGRSMTKFVKGEISGADCLLEIGEKGTSNISAAMFAVVGQAAIPIPIVGAMVGSMVGYALSSAFYNEFTSTLKAAEISKENRIRIEKECGKAIIMIRQYRLEMESQAASYLANYTNVFNRAFSQMDAALLKGNIDQFLEGANLITTSLGSKPQFSNMKEFNTLMESNEKIIL